MRNNPPPQRTLQDVLRDMSTKHVIALARVAKTRAHAFFNHPRSMMALRRELERRTSR